METTSTVARPAPATPVDRARRQREDQRLMQRMQEGDARARDEFIERYRPLGRRPRPGVLLLRGADDPRRAAPLLPRLHLGRAAGARPAGALPGRRGGAREAVGRARPLAD